jgi:hypothetical protein
MSTAALYYPNVTIVAPRHAGQSQNFDRTDLKLLTTAVLLWDSLEVIVPFPGFEPHPMIGEGQRDEEKAISEAFELVVTARALTDEEKAKLYIQLKKLIAGGIPDTLRFKVEVDNYNMYPEKLSPEIWELLQGPGLVSDGSDRYYGLRRDFGLIVMGLIADICAGGTRRKVTNYRDAHEAYSRLIAAQFGAIQDFQPDVQRAYTTLASLSLKSVDAGKLPLSKLVELRRREQEDGLLPPLRKNYRAAIDRYVERIKEAKSPADVELIEHEFASEIRDDFRHLKEMLKLEAGDMALTKGTTVLTSILSHNWASLLGSITNALPSYQLKRQQTLEKHQSAWLHVA